MALKQTVILVGHGGVPTDCPSQLVGEFKRLEAASRGKPTPELLAADAKVRAWPRNGKNDPYKIGLEAIAAALRQALNDHDVVEAYNEFCAPSLQDAVEGAIARGARQITVISTMYTRGGIHSETEIPMFVDELRGRHPGVDLRYAWPFPPADIAGFLANQIRLTEA